MGDSSRKEVDSLFPMLQALQQQFEQVTIMFEDNRGRMERQDTTIVALQRVQPQRNPNIRRQKWQSHVKEEFDVEFEVSHENEDDWVSINNHGRIKPRDRRIKGGLV